MKKKVNSSTVSETVSEPKIIVNFSAGKDSTAMLHLLLEHGVKPDAVVMFCSDWDFPEMEAHSRLVEEKTGLRIHRLYPPNPLGYYFSEHVKQRGPQAGERGYGWPSARCRWCTRIKIDTLNCWVRTLYPCMPYVNYIGFAVGEEKRAFRMEGAVRFPLLEYDLDEKECLQYCYNLGYDWGGLYTFFARVSCFCCPLQSRTDLLMLRRHRPELYKRMLCMDDSLSKNCPNVRDFRDGLTLRQIDDIFEGMSYRG